LATSPAFNGALLGDLTHGVVHLCMRLGRCLAFRARPAPPRATFSAAPAMPPRAAAERPPLFAFASAPTTDLRTGAVAPLSALWTGEGAKPLVIAFLRRLG
jgi:hypothetical protein